VIVFIPCSGEECKPDEADREWLPRRCLSCGQVAIIGHGRRRRQAHDDIHDWILVRRGLCKVCGGTLTVLPAWCVPRALYNLRARQEAVQQARVVAAERVAVTCRDPDRIADPSTIRRWLRRRVESLQRLLPNLSVAPTLVAWDWRAASRILIAEPTSP
jgi:hypothetical protein